MRDEPSIKRSPSLALLFGAPIGLLGGLVGLGAALKLILGLTAASASAVSPNVQSATGGK